MKILALDPGATRSGWAILGYDPLDYIASGVVHMPRGPKEAFQQYRMRLTCEWCNRAYDLLKEYEPDVLVTEIVPSRGAGIPEQLYLANVQITVVHAIASLYDYPVVQVSARSVQSTIAIRGQGKKITKPQVRNGVIKRIPELLPRIKEFVKIFEETDALAIGLYYIDQV